MTEFSRIQKGLFRTPQSFGLSTTDDLLQKLQWDLEQLEAIRWDEELGQNWGRSVSYKAIDCANSIWHMPEWVAPDLWGFVQRARVCKFLHIENHDTYSPIIYTQLRKAAISIWPDLDIFRIITNASKHQEVTQNPRPEIRTSTYLSGARRDNEPFMRPVMWLSVEVGGEKFDMVKLLQTGFEFWKNVWDEGRPA